MSYRRGAQGRAESKKQERKIEGESCSKGQKVAEGWGDGGEEVRIKEKGRKRRS